MTPYIFSRVYSMALAARNESHTPMTDMMKLHYFCHDSFALGALLVEETSQLVTKSLGLPLDIAEKVDHALNLDGLRLDILRRLGKTRLDTVRDLDELAQRAQEKRCRLGGGSTGRHDET